jgi:nitrite reductase/ring-hydroxylating ferredoxin subunit
MPRSLSEFFPKTIDLYALDRAKPNKREVDAGVEVVVVVRPEGLSIFRDLCPHMGAPLSEGKFDGAVLECPWHGYRYEAKTGALQENPNDKIFDCMKGLYKTYDGSKMPKWRLAPLAYEIEGGSVWVKR